MNKIPTLPYCNEAMTLFIIGLAVDDKTAEEGYRFFERQYNQRVHPHISNNAAAVAVQDYIHKYFN